MWSMIQQTYTPCIKYYSLELSHRFVPGLYIFTIEIFVSWLTLTFPFSNWHALKKCHFSLKSKSQSYYHSIISISHSCKKFVLQQTLSPFAMSSQEYESDEQTENAETAQSTTANFTKEGETATYLTEEETDVTEELVSEEEICEDSVEEKSKSYDEMSEKMDYTFSPLDLLTTIYSNPYYWAIFKSTLLFLLALKMARECNMLRIPMKEYRPFNRP